MEGTSCRHIMYIHAQQCIWGGRAHQVHPCTAVLACTGSWLTQTLLIFIDPSVVSVPIVVGRPCSLRVREKGVQEKGGLHCALASCAASCSTFQAQHVTEEEVPDVLNPCILLLYCVGLEGEDLLLPVQLEAIGMAIHILTQSIVTRLHGGEYVS